MIIKDEKTYDEIDARMEALIQVYNFNNHFIMG